MFSSSLWSSCHGNFAFERGFSSRCWINFQYATSPMSFTKQVGSSNFSSVDKLGRSTCCSIQNGLIQLPSSKDNKEETPALSLIILYSVKISVLQIGLVQV